MASALHGTLATPSRDDCLRSVSKVLHRIVAENVHSQPTCFDIDLFMNRNIQVIVPMISHNTPFTCFYQLPERKEINLPSPDSIFRFMRTIFEKLQLSSECSIISLIYVERLLETGIYFYNKNWRPIVLTSILVASKVWDDLSSWNVEFSDLFPLLPLKSINNLERLFLDTLKYNLFVASSVYATYYFALRALRGLDAKQIPRLYLNLGIGPAQKEEV